MALAASTQHSSDEDTACLKTEYLQATVVIAVAAHFPATLHSASSLGRSPHANPEPARIMQCGQASAVCL